MSLYQCGSIEEEPDVILSQWTIRETDTGARHFVGFNELSRDGRVSTPIKMFDPITRTGVTASGRRYQLVGPGGINGDAEYVWRWVLKLWKIDSWKDLTAELVPDWRNSKVRDEVLRSMGFPEANGSVISTLCTPGLPTVTVRPDVKHSSKFLWCARAYGRRTAGEKVRITAISEARGSCTASEKANLPLDEAELYLAAVRIALHTRAKESQPIDPEAPLPAHLKVWVSALESLEQPVGRTIARLDAFVSGGVAIASIHTRDWSRTDIRPFPYAIGDGLWEIFLRAFDKNNDPPWRRR